jgi:hypothetical protein
MNNTSRWLLHAEPTSSCWFGTNKWPRKTALSTGSRGCAERSRLVSVGASSFSTPRTRPGGRPWWHRNWYSLCFTCREEEGYFVWTLCEAARQVGIRMLRTAPRARIDLRKVSLADVDNCTPRRWCVSAHPVKICSCFNHCRVNTHWGCSPRSFNPIQSCLQSGLSSYHRS